MVGVVDMGVQVEVGGPLLAGVVEVQEVLEGRGWVQGAQVVVTQGHISPSSSSLQQGQHPLVQGVGAMPAHAGP
jgi:hypothetical protein